MPLDSYVTLGRSGLRVSPFTLGAMTFGQEMGWGATPETSYEIIAEYLDRGGNAIDTANFYNFGHSEKIIGDYLAAHPDRRDRIVLGTKFFCNLLPRDPNGGGGGRKGILRQLDESLRRLRTEYVDIDWLHNYDPVNPIEETLRTLDDLVTAGKVRYIGLSDRDQAGQRSTSGQDRDSEPATAATATACGTSTGSCHPTAPTTPASTAAEANSLTTSSHHTGWSTPTTSPQSTSSQRPRCRPRPTTQHPTPPRHPTTSPS